jgi:hypothetical protein
VDKKKNKNSTALSMKHKKRNAARRDKRSDFCKEQSAKPDRSWVRDAFTSP